MPYLDNNATTPLDPRVREAMLPFLSGVWGNPASIHCYGRQARAALDVARQQVAALVNARADQVVFTSGGTEANNLAIRGALGCLPAGRLLVGATEHASVLEPARSQVAAGHEVAYLPVDSQGRLDLATLEDSLHQPAALVSVMLANNETGVIQFLPGVAERLKPARTVLHTDAAQAAGKIPVDFAELGSNLMTLSAHKLYGPTGVGALIVDKRLEFAPLQLGGGQEGGLRCGTENLAGIVGFGMAAELAAVELVTRRDHLVNLRDRFEKGLKSLPGTTVFAAEAERLPNTVQFSLQGHLGEMLVMQLDRLGFAVSSGSACHSGSGRPSHVLSAMGISPTVAGGAVRVSFGKQNTQQEVDDLLAALTHIVESTCKGALLV